MGRISGLEEGDVAELEETLEVRTVVLVGSLCRCGLEEGRRGFPQIVVTKNNPHRGSALGFLVLSGHCREV